MAVVSKSIVAGVGARAGQLFLLASDGLPTMPAASGTATLGYFIEKIKDYTITGAEPQRINHYGADFVFAADQLPSTEAPSMQITTAVDNMSLDAAVGGLVERSYVSGELRAQAMETNKKGNEPQACIFLYRQALDTQKDSTTFGQLRQYNYRSVNSCRVTAQPTGGASSTVDQVYDITPTPTTRTFYGEAYSNTLWGCTTSAFNRGNTNYPGVWHVYRGTMTLGAYPLSYLPADSGAVKVWVDGSFSVPGSVTLGASPAFSLTAVPTNDQRIIALCQTAAAIE